MASKRIYWAVQAVGIAPHNSTTFVSTKGVQSVGITTTFNLEQVFELGQLAIYENIENIPDVEVTLEKVLDGHPLLYHLCTRGATSGTLSGRSNQQCNVSLSIFGDVQDSASGTPVSEVNMSGMYLSSVTYTLPVDGNCTESVTLVGNNKVWRTGTAALFQPNYTNTDTPFGASASGGVQRRENVLFAGSTIGATPDCCVLPSGTGGIPGISSSGTNDKDADGVYGAHIQSITVSADLGREQLNELGRKGPYFRFINFPVEVSCDIEVLTTQGDNIGGTETGINSDGTNLNDQRIFIKTQDSTAINLGSKNKLSSVSYGGADAGGGQATVTYSYVTYNDLTISHDNDPG